MAEHGEDILGTVLEGRYRVEAVLGGAHAGGTVFRGRDATAGTTVVVRCPLVPPDLTPEQFEEALAAFLAEAAQLAKISQGSNDVERLIASGVAEPPGSTRVPFTIFEWLSGRSLERQLAERASGVSISEALVTLEPAARALATAHAIGAAHRDVRPANLWLAEVDGRTTLKVAAWGLATRFGPGDAAFAPEYGAPEHFKRSYGAIGPATDVYGLALCVIEMVTGKRALEGADAGELYLATSDLARRPSLSARGSHVSDAFEAVLQRALAVDPKRRWQSARELWDALVAAVPEIASATPSVRSRTSDRPPGIVGATTHARVMQDSGPASVPPGVARRAASEVLSGPRPIARPASVPPEASAATVTPATEVPVERSGRVAVVTFRADAPKVASGGKGEKSGAGPWVLVALLALVAAGLVVAKIGATTQAGSSATATKASARAPGSAAEDPAVHVEPFLLDMVKVPAGSFAMGSDHDGKGDRPTHHVTLSHAFYIDRTEVRADAYWGCVAEKVCTPNRVHGVEIAESTYGCNSESERPTHPANCIDRVQAETYCAFVKKRLPTEAEWEYAARGSDGREFPWGNTAPTTCAMAILTGMTGECGDRHGTSEVGTTTEGKSAFGLLDMAGNVWEWVADGYEAYPGDGTDGGASEGGAAGIVDPQSALQPSGRGILRGGSWDYSVTSAKVTYRLPFPAANGNVSTGVRCARDAE